MYMHVSVIPSSQRKSSRNPGVQLPHVAGPDLLHPGVLFLSTSQGLPEGIHHLLQTVLQPFQNRESFTTKNYGFHMATISCVYMYIYIYTHVYTCIYMYIHVDRYIHTYVRTYVCTIHYITLHYIYIYIYHISMLVSCRGTTHRKKHMRLDQANVGVGMEVDGC